jgi:ribosome-associated translation inhibitor RaiA
MPFEVEITGRNMEITDRLDDYVTKKVSKLDPLQNLPAAQLIDR